MAGWIAFRNLIEPDGSSVLLQQKTTFEAPVSVRTPGWSLRGRRRVKELSVYRGKPLLLSPRSRDAPFWGTPFKGVAVMSTYRGYFSLERSGPQVAICRYARQILGSDSALPKHCDTQIRQRPISRLYHYSFLYGLSSTIAILGPWGFQLSAIDMDRSDRRLSRCTCKSPWYSKGASDTLLSA